MFWGCFGEGHQKYISLKQEPLYHSAMHNSCIAGNFTSHLTRVLKNIQLHVPLLLLDNKAGLYFISLPKFWPIPIEKEDVYIIFGITKYIYMS